MACSGCGTECGSGCAIAACTGYCSALCGSGCDGSCSSSSGTGGGSGSTACTADGCTTTCAVACSTECSGKCKATCADDCVGSCKDDCMNDCDSTATTASCGVLCAGECMGCTGTCSAECADDCTGTCKTTCKNTCENVCTSCEGTCKESCSGTNSLIVQASELEWIMPYVRNEIYRRSGFNEEGEFLHKPEYRHYSGPILSEPDDSLFILDSDAEVIRVGHGIPIIDMLLKVCDFEDARFVREFDLIPGVYNREKLINFINFLSSTPFDAPASHCRGACTGLCDNNCTTTCTGSCLEECSSCGKMCSGMCSSTCLGCTNSCGKSCGESCGDTCDTTVTGCSGCSSGCTGCTGCVNTCEGTCSDTCSSSCSGCMAGCFGVSGLNDTCGACSSNCVSTCGSKVVSIPITPDHHSIILYHDGGLYGKLSTLYHGDDTVYVDGSDGDIIVPPFTSISHQFSISGGAPQQERWVSLLNGLSVSCSGGQNNTITFKTTSPEETEFYSCTTKDLVLYSKAEVGLSFGIVWEVYKSTNDAPDKLIIDVDSMVNITAKDSDGNIISGARDNRWALYINSVEYALPFTGILKKDDVVTFTGDNITYTVQRHKDEIAKKSIKIPFGRFNNSTQISDGFGIVPFCLCRTMRIWFDNDGTRHYQLGILEPCELVDNPHVKITSSLRVSTDGQVDTTASEPITRPECVGQCTLDKVPDIVTITVTANEFKEICSDGSYMGILYIAGFELYEGYKYDMPLGQSYTTDGRYDSDLNVVLIDAETYEILNKVPLCRDNTSYEQYSFTIPDIPGYSKVTNYASASYPAFEDRQQVYAFNTQYTVYGRNSFVLFLHK